MPTCTISGVRHRPASVLIVDDEVSLAWALAELLSDEFAVRTTSRPLEALEWLSSGAWYDVILSDVMMPEITGLELHERIHAVRPELSARMVFMTGGVTQPCVQQGLDALPNPVLDKPFDVGDLRELIRRRVAADLPRQGLRSMSLRLSKAVDLPEQRRCLWIKPRSRRVPGRSARTCAR